MSRFSEIDLATWRERVEQELEGEGLDSLAVETLAGVVLSPLYTRAEMPSVGAPGRSPYVRGSRSAPTDPPWLCWQRIDAAKLEDAVEAVRDDRRGGVHALWLRLDRSARLGRGPEGDDATPGGGIVAVDAADLRALIEAAGDGPLAIRLDAGGNALAASAALFAALESSGRERADLRLHLAMDPLGALAADGTLPTDPEALGRECAMLAGRSARKLSRVRALSVDTGPYARAGADAAQQLSLGMATAIQYLRWLEQHGVSPEEGAGQIEFLFEGDRHFLLEVAKLRAARWMWSRIQRACGMEPVAPWIHSSTGWRTLTRRDPWTNLLRATVQATAAIVGGADSLTTTPFDAPLGRPEALGRRLARNTQAVLAEESRLGDPLDVGGGSYAIESLTRALATNAWERLQAVEASGGMMECLRGGLVHEALAESTRRHSERIRSGRDVLLGVTRYEDSDPLEVERPPEDVEQAVAAAVERRGGRAETDLTPLAAATASGEDDGAIGEALMGGARAGATIAELAGALRPGARPSEIAALPVQRDEDLVPPDGSEEAA